MLPLSGESPASARVSFHDDFVNRSALFAMLVRPKRPLALVPREAPRRATRGPAEPLAPIVGREDVIARVAESLAEGARIVTLLGPPGMGKTTLARVCLARFGGAYERAGGSTFCDLSQARTADDLAFAVLSALGERASAGRGPDLDARAAEALGAMGPAMLVLDNFEQLAFAAASVARWCVAAPELIVIVTSRERLAIGGEVVVELPPLGCPTAAASAEAALASDAVRLFSLRARAVGGSVEGDPAVLGEIVRRLDGIPLAIELAAARTRVLSPAELARRLAAGQDVLASKDPSAGRHATLAKAIEWSWELLTDEEKATLARASVFAGSFGLDDAERVTEAPLDVLAALRDKSLVHPAEGGRLALYVSIRDYAARRLAERGEAEVTRAHLAHARAFAATARRFNDARSLQGTSPEPELHVAIRRDAENLVAALAWVAARPDEAAELAELEAELAVAVASLSALPGEACARALGRAEARCAARGDGRSRAQVLLARQLVLASLGRYEACRRDLDEVRSMAGAPEGLRTLALVFRGIQLRFEGDARAAWEDHVQASAEIDRLGLPRLRAMNEACMGRIGCDLADPARARLHNERAFADSDAIGDLWLGALALANLAQLEQEAQRFDRAEELLERALARLRDAGEAHYEAIYSSVCGDLFFEEGRLEIARRWYAEGARWLGRLVAHRQTAVMHAAAAALEADDGDLVLAASHLAFAEQSAARADNPVVRLSVELHRGHVEIARAPDAERAAVAARWRARLARTNEGAEGAIAGASLDVRFARRMLERAIDRASGAVVGPALVMAEDGAWFEGEDGERVDLGKRASLRRILVALRDHHASAPGQGFGVDALVAAGWPGERVLPAAAATRVRVAIATIRRLGLRSVLLTREDGYLLDPAARVTVVPAR